MTIPASIATACAAHDRHRLDVLDALLDEAAPSAVRELLGAALDLCASLRTERDELRAKLDAAPKVCAIHSYEHGPGPCMTCGAWPPGTRELIATCRTRIAGLESAADERSKEDKARSTRMDEIRAALGAHPFASDDHIADRIRALTARVAELEARPVLTVDRLTGACAGIAEIDGEPAIDVAASLAATILAKLGPVTLPAQDRAEELAAEISRTIREAASKAWLHSKTATSTATEAGEIAIGDVLSIHVSAALAKLGAAPGPTAASRPVFAGVSVDELCRAYGDAFNPAAMDPRADGIRAVLARLEVSLVAPVDPEDVARDYHDNRRSSGIARWLSPEMDEHRAAHIAAMRATVAAAGIPVTPEVGK